MPGTYCLTSKQLNIYARERTERSEWESERVTREGEREDRASICRNRVIKSHAGDTLFRLHEAASRAALLDYRRIAVRIRSSEKFKRIRSSQRNCVYTYVHTNARTYTQSCLVHEATKPDVENQNHQRKLLHDRVDKNNHKMHYRRSLDYRWNSVKLGK